jgi:hypothetical protein
MTKIPLKFIKEHSYCELQNVTIFRGVAVFGDNNYQQQRTISMLGKIDNRTISNLAATSDHEGAICFFWKDRKGFHFSSGNVELPDGDIWIGESFFLS